MLRKSFPLILKPIIRPCALNFLKCTCNNLSTSCSNNERSVLADPGIIKRENQERFYLQKILTVQQIEKFDEIQNLTSAQDVIKFLQNNKKVTVTLHAPLFLQIYKIIKSNKSAISAEMFVRSADFENFCNAVNKSAIALRPGEILSILKTLKSLNISMNSTLSQTLLEILLKSINELNISELIFTELLIRDAPSSRTVDALKVSLPVVFNSNVQSKLAYGHPKLLTDAMRFAMNARVPFKTIDLIAEAALDVRDQLTYQQCKDVVNKFLYNNCKVMIGPRRELYLFCMDKVKAEMDEKMSFKEMRQMISCIVNDFLLSNSFFYDEVFLAKVTKYIVANKLNLIEVGTVMRSLTCIGYVDICLINYVDLLLSQTADFKTSPNVMTIIAHISSCSDAQYLPPKWDTYEQKIVDYILNLEDIEIPILIITLELITLNRWHIPLINKVFAEDFLRSIHQKREKQNYLSILKIYQAVKTMKKHDVEVLPSDDTINKAIQYQIELQEDRITAPLETLFGGKSYVVNGILTKYGHYIDHLIVLNKTGQPSPIREEGVKDGQNLQDIVLPANDYSFAIVLLSSLCYCIDGVKLRGKFKLMIDTLATQGVIPVPISMTLWKSLHDAEKLPHLKREIFSRIPGNVRTRSPSKYFDLESTK